MKTFLMRIKRRPPLVVATTAVAIGLSPGLAPRAFAVSPVPPSGGAAASTTPDDPQRIDNQDPALLAEMRKQERLYPAAHALLKAAMKLPVDSGYAGVAYEGDGVTLHYKGVLPPDMATAVTEASQTAPVAVKEAAYSRAELEQAQASITAAAEMEHSDIQAIGVADDGSGLVVEKMPPATATAMRATLASKGVTSKDADALLADIALKVPVTVTTATGPIVLLASREDDHPPWNGGSQYETWRELERRNLWCSTGFGVWKNSQTYVLTAAHCMTAPDRAYNGHFGGCCFEEIGPVYQEDWDKDILLIDARGSALIFDGGVNSSWTKPVHSWGYRMKKELLCTSGSRSGTICGNRTDPYEHDIRGCDSDGDCFKIHDLARADNVDGRCVGDHGDSGGPVFALDSDGVRAKGVIVGTGEKDCTILYFQDMDEIVDGFLGAVPHIQ